MKKLIVVLMFVYLLTGCDLAYNQEQIDKIKSEIYSEIQTSIDNLQYEELKEQILLELKIQIENELIDELESDLYNELSLLIDEKLNENEIFIQTINQRIDEMIANSLSEQTDHELLKQELQIFVTSLINDLSMDMKSELIDELNLNNQTTNTELQNFETLIIDVVNKNTQSVLGVSNFQNVYNTLQEVSTGSGVIYKRVNDDYYLVTNEHVVRDAKKLRVVLENNEYVDAILLGSDMSSDLAVLKFTLNRDLPVSTFADSSLITRGQIAIAIGSPLGFEYYGSVTMGVISGLSRLVHVDNNEDGVIDFTEVLIQHDVAINPGNSGGPLYNINGEIIGINNMKSIEENVDNIGFAIPSNTVVEIINQLE